MDINTLSLQTGVEAFAIKLLQEETKSEPEHLKSTFDCVLEFNEIFENEIPEEKTVLVPAIAFKIETYNIGIEIIEKYSEQLGKKFYKLFLCNNSYDEDDYQLVITFSKDEYSPLFLMRTNGVNQGWSTLDLILKIISLNNDFDLNLELIFAENDGCDFRIRNNNFNQWKKLSERVNEFCPDVTDYDEEIDEYAVKTEQNKILHFWFD